MQKITYLIKIVGIFFISFLLTFSVACQENKKNEEKQQNRVSENTKNNNQENNRKNLQKENEERPSQQKRKKNALISPKWGKRFYKAHNGKIEALEHIWLRHNFESKYDYVSRFAKKYNTRESIQKLVENACETATKEEISTEAGGHRSAVVEMNENIGLSQKGKSTTKIQIFLDNNDFVKTAYPL